ncbi:MAG: hypothetical protein NC343_08750 [Muribaculum sp.]|nr:hypothetical protein [Muribaculum sp.]MCM1293054.1 hypothetical protein [Bacteroides sp.]MCM1413731.1 hypothetical protein [Bacteroides sp.]MCM1472250.1 hypothetical protein [Bacteroides sp.]
MLSQSIIDKILAKYGKEHIFSADCAPLGKEIGISETTVKRMLGLVGADSKERYRTPHNSTMDILAKWLGYENHLALLNDVGEGTRSSEFTSLDSVKVAELATGTKIRLTYHPCRTIVMTYLGNFEFLVNDSINSKLIAGDKLKITHLIINQELIAGDVVRDGKSLGAYRGAKDGGLLSLEIIA